jgi:hypothetical protein
VSLRRGTAPGSRTVKVREPARGRGGAAPGDADASALAARDIQEPANSGVPSLFTRRDSWDATVSSVG